MARLARYVEDHESFAEFILSDQIRDVTAEVAEDITQIVRAGSARSDRPGIHMADKWTVDKDAGVRKVGRNIRVRVDISNPDPAAAAQEFGAGSRRGQRTRILGRTASLFGDFHDHGESSS